MQRTSGDHRGRQIVQIAVAVLFLLLFAAPAFAKIQLSVDVGFSNRFRPGRWTPLYITAADAAPRQVTLEIYAPTDRRYAMKILQSVVIGPQPVTVAIYVPISYQIDETTVNVLDSNTGRRLESLVLSDYSAYAGQRGTGPEPIDINGLFVGVSGAGGSERMVEAQFEQSHVHCAYISPDRLPAVPIGYDALDLLILNQGDIGRLAIEQQRAICDWVLAGGTLLFWPGVDPIPTSGPLIELLPCSIGQTQITETDPAALTRAGLAARFAKLSGRELVRPTADAKPIFPLKPAALKPGAKPPLDPPAPQSPWGYRRWAGFGQVIVMGPDVSQLLFDNKEKASAFWDAALKGVMVLPPLDAEDHPNYSFSTESRRSVPLRQTLDWIGDVPGAGQFGFTYVAGVMLALMFVVGPVDWFVLKWTGRQPWTWVTVSGWVALVTLGAIYVGHVFKAGDLYYRSASVLDEAGQMRVAATDVVGIYSPQTKDYTIATDTEAFWKPASDGNMMGNGAVHIDTTYHQDYRGNTPLRMLINVWNSRYQEGSQFGPAAPTIDAKLAHTTAVSAAANATPQSTSGAKNKNAKLVEEQMVIGKITNRGSVRISHLHIRTSAGTAQIEGSIEPGATLDINAKLNSKDRKLATQPVQDQNVQWQRYQSGNSATTQPDVPALAGLADDRSVRIDEMLRDRTDIACVYATFEAPPDRAKLENENPKSSHITLVRALIPLENAGAINAGVTR